MFKVFKAAFAGLIIITSSLANAGLIERIDFDSNASEFDFTGLTNGAINVGDGNLSISNGTVNVNVSVGDVIAPSYYDGNDSSVIRFDFVSQISAFGLDFTSYNQDTTLSLFDISNNLVESFTISTSEQVSCANELCGYVGIDTGSNLVSYATIDTPLNGHELYIDNIIYQTAEIPEPATLAIFVLGLAGLTSRRLKNK